MTNPVGQVRCSFRHRQPTEAMFGTLCSHHFAQLRECLQDVLELFALSRLYLLPGSVQMSGIKHTKAADAPAPIRLDVAALSDRRNPAQARVCYENNYDMGSNLLVSNGPDIPDIPGVLEDWAGWVTEGRELTPMGRDWTITGSVRRLQTHLAWIAGQDELEDFDESVRDCRRALAVAMGDRTARPIQSATCGSTNPETGETCGGRLWPAEDFCSVRCASCGETIPPEMLAFLGRQYLDSLPKTLSLPEAAKLCGVGHGTIRQWVNRGYITRNEDGTYDRTQLWEFREERAKVS